MDKNQPIAPAPLILAPAHLWVGPDTVVLKKVKTALKQHLCPAQGCNSCMSCTQVDMQEHHAIMWFATDKNYTLDALEAIHSTIAYALEPGKHYFFIIQNADHLSMQAANRLLKSIEEPPAGYHFVLLCDSLEPILPTIRSRCIIYHDASQNTSSTQARMTIWNHFTTSNRNPVHFLKDIDELKLSDQEASQLCDALFAFWMEKTKRALLAKDETAYNYAYKQMHVYQDHLHKLPMPGSSKLFLKNLYLQSIAHR